MTDYVAYYIHPNKRPVSPTALQNELMFQEEQAKAFIQLDPSRQLVTSFTERGSIKRNRAKWEALDQAIAYCKAHRAHLLIVQFKKVITNTHFVDKVQQFLGRARVGTEFHLMDPVTNLPDIYCCDYVAINRDNFRAIVEHECRQREEHRKRILMGLKKPNAKKSGNPNAAKVISMVNWPKTNNAIIFALHLQPIIEAFQRKGYSQRRMVQKLNEQGIHAPEGGKWVLSQLQKVLERIKVNQAAMRLESELSTHSLSESDLLDRINAKSIPPIKGKEWTPEQVHKLSERFSQFQDIVAFNRFILEAKPILEEKGLSMDGQTFVKALDEKGIEIPPVLKRMCR